MADIVCLEIARTPGNRDYLFGFNDLCPWDPSNRRIVLIAPRSAPNRLPGPDDIADVVVWAPDEGEISTVGETRGWNYQQGARARWFADGSILFNDVEAGIDRALIVSAEGSLLRTLPKAVYALSPDERFGASPSFARLARLLPGYGYAAAAAQTYNDAPRDDGLWLTEMATGRSRLAISLADLATDSAASGQHFLSHISFNPGGSKMMFVHSVMREGGALYGRLMIANRDGSGRRAICAEKVSHPCWIADNRVLSWSRRSHAIEKLRRVNLRVPGLRLATRLARKWQGGARNGLLNEGLTVTGLDGSSEIVGKGLIEEDGHFAKHPTRNLVVGDTYADRQGRLGLYLFDIDRRRRIEVASYAHGVKWPRNVDLRCDLHPRWDREGKRILVDIASNGTRSAAIIDATPALDAF